MGVKEVIRRGNGKEMWVRSDKKGDRERMIKKYQGKGRMHG